MASSKPWIPFYTGDYLRDPEVMELSVEAQGAYLILLFHMWEGNGKIRFNCKSVAKMLRIRDKKASHLCQKIEHLLTVFEENGDIFATQKRLKSEIEKSQTISDKRRRAVGSRADRQEPESPTNVHTNEVTKPEPVVSDLNPYSHSHSHSHIHKDINILRPDENPGEILTLKSQDPEKPEKPEKPPKLQEPLEEWFEKFFAHYPRRDDRKRAHTAFMAIFSKAPPSKHRAIMENLVLRLTAYVGEREGAVKSDPDATKFTKLPATWLRAHDFTVAPHEDEILMEECWEPVTT